MAKKTESAGQLLQILVEQPRCTVSALVVTVILHLKYLVNVADDLVLDSLSVGLLLAYFIKYI